MEVTVEFGTGRYGLVPSYSQRNKPENKLSKPPCLRTLGIHVAHLPPPQHVPARQAPTRHRHTDTSGPPHHTNQQIKAAHTTHSPLTPGSYLIPPPGTRHNNTPIPIAPLPHRVEPNSCFCVRSPYLILRVRQSAERTGAWEGSFSCGMRGVGLLCLAPWSYRMGGVISAFLRVWCVVRRARGSGSDWRGGLDGGGELG